MTTLTPAQQKIVDDFNALPQEQRDEVIRRQGESLARNYRPGERQARLTPSNAELDQSFANALSDSDVRIWINACNHEPARQALRQLLAYRVRGVSKPLLPDAQSVAVKPLQWVKPFGSDRLEKSDTILGVYKTWTHHEAGGRWFWQLSAPVSSFRIVEGEGGCEAEVQRAAEADYRSRILSALIQPTPAETEGVSEDKLRAMLANLDHTTDAGWKADGYMVMGDWQASGAIARVTGSQHAFADTRHIADCDPPTMRAILTELLASRATLSASPTPPPIGDGEGEPEVEVTGIGRNGATGAIVAVTVWDGRFKSLNDMVPRYSLEAVSRQLEEAREALVIVRRRVNSARGAIESNQVVDKDVHGSLSWVLRTIDDALRAKETVSHG